MNKATQFTRHDIDSLLQRAPNYFALEQNWHIEMWNEDTGGEKHLVVFWSGCLLEENVEGGAGSFVWWKTIDDYWHMTEDGEWHRHGEDDNDEV